MPPEIEQGNLAHLALDALATNQPVGHVGLAGGFVAGFGLTYVHARYDKRKIKRKDRYAEYIMAQQNGYQKPGFFIISYFNAL